MDNTNFVRGATTSRNIRFIKPEARQIQILLFCVRGTTVYAIYLINCPPGAKVETLFCSKSSSNVTVLLQLVHKSLI